MAEQKIEETKPAVPRRAVRPFIGPAGAGQSARPPLRPNAPSERPRPAAFGPPPLQQRPEQRPSLGAAPDPAPPPSVPTAAASLLPAPVAELPIVETPPAVLRSPLAALPEDEIVVSAATPVAVAPVRPVTSEMVAIDAIDAFEAVWSSPEITGASATVEPASAPIDELSLGGGLDGPHLWTDEITAAPEQAIEPETVAEHEASKSFDAVWSEPASSDIGIPAWLADDADPVSDAVSPAEASLSWPEAYATPPEAPVNEMAVENTDADDGLWPDPILAEYAPYIPTPSSVSAIPTPSSLRAIQPVTHDASQAPVIQSSTDPVSPTLGAVAGPEFSESALVEPFVDASMDVFSAAPLAGSESTFAVSSTDPVSTPIEAVAHENAVRELSVREPVPHEVRVSAALDRLAERVRSGEIDVSSVAAEAPEAALLASVLAALLGGSSSR